MRDAIYGHKMLNWVKILKYRAVQACKISFIIINILKWIIYR